MLQLDDLRLENHRCYINQQARFESGLNLVLGANASGKTSLLEAIAFLFHKRSFRAQRPGRMLRLDSQQALLSAHFYADARKRHRIACQFSANEQKFSLDGALNPSRAHLLKCFPVFIFETASAHKLIHEPESRRRWLDRTLFHVEPSFLSIWRDFSRALSQRNAALRTRSQGLSSWTEQFLHHSQRIDQLRKGFFEQLQPEITRVLSLVAGELLPPIEFGYRQGWRESQELAEQLDTSQDSEMRLGYTLAGPHRADFSIHSSRTPVRDHLSRGQLKLLGLCLTLAQLQLCSKSGQKGLFLWDDWIAELAVKTQITAIDLVREFSGQSILTAPSEHWPSELTKPEHMFHVEHLGTAT